MLYVISYDIPQDRRRTKLARRLKDFGERVQYSVFEAHLEPRQLRELLAAIRELICPEEDTVRVYGLCDTCRGKAQALGLGEITVDPVIFIIGP